MSIVTNGWGFGSITTVGFGNIIYQEAELVPVISISYSFSLDINSCASIRDNTYDRVVRDTTQDKIIRDAIYNRFNISQRTKDCD